MKHVIERFGIWLVWAQCQGEEPALVRNVIENNIECACTFSLPLSMSLSSFPSLFPYLCFFTQVYVLILFAGWRSIILPKSCPNNPLASSGPAMIPWTSTLVSWEAAVSPALGSLACRMETVTTQGVRLWSTQQLRDGANPSLLLDNYFSLFSLHMCLFPLPVMYSMLIMFQFYEW